MPTVTPPLAAKLDPLVFADAPKLIYWEPTRACDLACKHCRAEAKALLAELRAFGDPPPRLVMTGSDPLCTCSPEALKEAMDMRPR